MPPGSFDHASMRTVASVAAAMIVVAAVAADTPVAPPPAMLELPAPPELPQAPAGTGASTQSGMPGCAVWTDRCVICQRDGGVVACSNIGIACQRQAMLCLRAEAAEEKKPAN
jgi:hypothetical protein